jgi:hypothetical protein
VNRRSQSEPVNCPFYQVGIDLALREGNELRRAPPQLFKYCDSTYRIHLHTVLSLQKSLVQTFFVLQGTIFPHCAARFGNTCTPGWGKVYNKRRANHYSNSSNNVPCWLTSNPQTPFSTSATSRSISCIHLQENIYPSARQTRCTKSAMPGSNASCAP